MSHQEVQRAWWHNVPQCVLWLALLATVVLPSCGPSQATYCREIQRIPVSSTAMRSVGYDESQHVMTIEFHNAAVYEYRGVAAEIHADLMRAPSHGQYFHQHVRNAGYTTTRIR